MRWLFCLAIGSVLAAGCGKTVYRAHESQYCSSVEDDDPYYECARSDDFICITTYSETPMTANGEIAQAQPRWLCRLACTPGVDKCAVDEICCPGTIYGRDYGKKGGCVPNGFCQGQSTKPTTADAGAKDAAAPDATAPVDGPDAATGAAAEAPADAPGIDLSGGN